MSHVFLSPEWIQQLREQLAGDLDFAREASKWPFGPVLFVVESDGEHVTEASAVRFRLAPGALGDVQIASASVDRVPTAFSSTLARWRAFASGGLTLVDGVRQARFAFRGDLPAVARHADLFAAIAAALGRIETAWQDEVEAAAPASART